MIYLFIQTSCALWLTTLLMGYVKEEEDFSSFLLHAQFTLVKPLTFKLVICDY